MKSLRKDRERWWTMKASAAEKSRALYQLDRSTSPRKAMASETMSEIDTGECNVNLNRPSAEEREYQITLLKRDKISKSGGLYPALSIEGGKSMTTLMWQWFSGALDLFYGTRYYVQPFRRENSDASPIQMHPKCAGEIVVTRSPRMSGVRSSKHGHWICTAGKL
ncbi:hypothetical protein T265_00609 [Opisthorchis viverrini]|uniref:Uncharacterized protein n=1 Tax=Opisthorchis viverrini TaxID=6198 RepID=A0A075AJJ5_OPIVI|nr:hypothetical protein T265_00609 [Opisthorchis viverrini]KER33494.1 hypothetical protein T265_00609 [Opisthorchis viverrini]